ncbi:MAG: hypothetical protein M3Z23_18095, partial [Acidobacteriota bacterium]|nr:hypothetical protein [Acidobacteriota bacterium]
SYNATEQVDFEADFNPANFNVPAGVNRSFDLPAFQSGINFLLGRIGTVYRGFSSPDLQSYRPGLFTYQTRYNESDLYVQDTWKINRNLTVDLGLRLEMKFAPSAASGVIAHPNQALVAGGAPTDTASWIPGSIYKSRLGNLGPSLGIAWDPFGTGKTSVRANYRLAYDRINSFVFSSQVLNNIPGVTYNYNDTSYGQNGGRLAGLGLVPPPSVSPASLASPAPYSSSSVAVVDPNLKFPTTHEWSFSLQRQIARQTVIQADYIGRRAYHLEGAYNANQPNLFANGYLDALRTVQAGGQSALLNSLFSADSRIGSGQTASDMIRANYSSALAQNSVASVLNSLGTRLQRGTPVTVLSGQSPFAVIPYPQFAGGVVVIDSNDFSTYNGLVLQVQRQFGGGVSGSFSYTFSKALDTRSQDPTFGTSVNRGSTAQAASSTPFDIYNRALNYAPADYDHTHVFQANGVYELPFGKGRRFLNSSPGLFERIIGGFEVAGFMNRYSGRPFTVFSGNFQFSSVVSTPANCTGCSRTGFGTPFDQAGVKYFFSTDQVAKFSIPGPGQFGNAGRNYFRGPGLFDIDMSLIKRTRITERFNLELRADATNLTNTPSFGLPTQSFASSTFGRIRSSVESASRKIQLGAKVDF